MMQSRDGFWSKNSSGRMDTFSIDLKDCTLTVGNHYKIRISHSMQRKAGLWSGDTLNAEGGMY